MNRIVYVAIGASLIVPTVAFAADGGLAAQGAFESDGFAGGVYKSAICDVLGLMGGNLGGMLTAAALTTGLVAAAVGGFNQMRSAVMVAVGAFALSAGVSIYFGDFGCGANNGGGGNGGGAAVQPANPGGDPFGDNDP